MNILFSWKVIASGWASAVFALAGYKSFYSNKNKLIFANYQSYMNPDLVESSKEEFDMKFEYFENDKQVPSYFKNGIYDAGIVSNSTLDELIKKDLVKPINWTKLDLKKADKSSVTTKDEAKELFTENVKTVLNKNQKYIEYAVPYFLSTFSFYYRGQEIEGLKNTKTWSEIVKAIVKEDRFKSNKDKPQLGMIDDPRTIYSMSRLLADKNSLDLENNEPYDLQNMKNIFNNLTSHGITRESLGKKTMFMNSDSSIVLDALSQKNIQGAFMYNGDAAFALQGGNAEEEVKKDDFHAVTPNKSIYILDCLAISKNITQEKEEKLYSFIKKIFFEGQSEDDMLQKEDDEYKFASAKNFDYVYYTPTLKKFIEKVKTNNDTASDDEHKDLKKKILLLEDNGDTNNKLFEGYLEDKAVTNMFLAYEDWKSQL